MEGAGLQGRGAFPLLGSRHYKRLIRHVKEVWFKIYPNRKKKAKTYEIDFSIAYRAIFIPKLTSSAINGLFPLCCK